jgi:acyl-CoA synthetase (AMP-forming)/AMP-acid ligase II
MIIEHLPWNRPAMLADRVCMRDTNVELTYAEVARRVDAVAGQFAAAGVGRGDVVAVMLPNRVELLLGLMAAWRLSAAATPVNPVFTPNEAGYQIADSGAKLLLAADADAGADYGVPVLPAGESNAGPFGSLPAPDTRPDDLALLIYTSGSTGRPKGIYARLAELPANQLGDTSSVRFAVCGAAPVPVELLRRSESRFGFPIIEGYGLTEGTCASAINPLDGMRKPGTVGVALPGQQVATMRPDGSFAAVGGTGEVVIKGPNVMRGYLGRPEATAEAIVDGWLHTGDVGVLDQDGYLTIVDRIKDMIIRGGENIYPKEIESVLCRHGAVLQAAVIGVPHEVYGEVPVAYVATYPDASVTAGDLLALCRANLTTIKIPTAIHIVTELPRNAVGKIDKPALRASYG